MNLDLIWYTVALVGAVLVGVVVIVWVDRWRKRSNLQAPADELGQYRGLFDQGLLSPEEYDRIRRRLEQRTEAKPPDASAPPNATPADSASASAAPAQAPPVSPPLSNGPPADPGSH
jgi:hypothetical protein